jgi:hypothetical protein
MTGEPSSIVGGGNHAARTATQHPFGAAHGNGAPSRQEAAAWPVVHLALQNIVIFGVCSSHLACSMSLWVGSHATSTPAVSDTPAGHPRVQLTKGLESIRYRHQWFGGSYLCHISITW